MAENIAFVGAEAQVNFVDPLNAANGLAGSQDNAQITALANGNFVVVYESPLDSGGGPDSIGPGLLWQEFTASGVRLTGPNRLDLDGAGLSDPAVAARSDNGFVAVWQQEGDIKLALVGPGVSSEPAEFDVALSAGSQYGHPSVATLANGSYFVAFQSTANSNGRTGVVAALVPPEGVNNPPAFLISTPGAPVNGIPAVAASGNNTVIVWTEGAVDTGDIKLKLFGPTGTLLDADTVIDDAAGLNSPDVTTLNDGRVVIVWEGAGANLGEIFGRIYNPATGAFSTDVFTVSDRIGDQSDPSVAALPDGGFIVTWSDQSGQFGDVDLNGINGRRFEASGAPAGDEFRFNSGTAGDQFGSDVAVNAAGQVFAVWTNTNTENTTDTSPTGVQGQMGQVVTEVVNDVPGAHVIGTYNLSETINGLDGNDTILAFGGNDTINGGTGADIMKGGLGNDTYVVDNPGDVVNETGGGGNDTVRSSRNFSLSDTAHAKGTIEGLVLIGSANADGTGNGLANQITGNSGANTLRGLGGNDVISGGGGNDVLVGGFGQDDLNGGGGADRFDFNAVAETPTGGGRDIINGFSRSQDDRIDLSSLDADRRAANPGNDAFTFIGGRSFADYHADHPTVFGMVRFENGILLGNVNGNLAADFAIKVNGISSLVAGDLFL